MGRPRHSPALGHGWSMAILASRYDATFVVPASSLLSIPSNSGRIPAPQMLRIFTKIPRERGRPLSPHFATLIRQTSGPPRTACVPPVPELRCLRTKARSERSIMQALASLNLGPVWVPLGKILLAYLLTLPVGWER